MTTDKAQPFIKLLCHLAIFLVASIHPAQANVKTNVRFCIPNASVYPFFLYENDEMYGINHELIQAAFEQEALHNAQLKFVLRPWKRCNIELQSGGVDMVIGGYEEERDSAGIYPNELGFELKESVVSTAGVCFISVKGPQELKTRKGMAGETEFNVGIEAGFSQVHNPEIHPQWLVIYNHLEKYRLLEKGRVDAIVQVCAMDDYPIATKAEVSGYQDFVTLTPPYLSNPAYVVFSKAFSEQHTELAKIILQEIQKVDKQQIYQRYRSNSE